MTQVSVHLFARWRFWCNFFSKGCNFMTLSEVNVLNFTSIALVSREEQQTLVLVTK